MTAADVITETVARLRRLPDEYQRWVISEAQGQGLPTLRAGVTLGRGQVQSYDVLIARCEREIESRSATEQEQ